MPSQPFQIPLQEGRKRIRREGDDFNARMRAGDDDETELYRQIFQMKIDDPFPYHVVKNVYDSMAVLKNQYIFFRLHEKCFLSKIIFLRNLGKKLC